MVWLNINWKIPAFHHIPQLLSSETVQKSQWIILNGLQVNQEELWDWKTVSKLKLEGKLVRLYEVLKSQQILLHSLQK